MADDVVENRLASLVIAVPCNSRVAEHISCTWTGSILQKSASASASYDMRIKTYHSSSNAFRVTTSYHEGNAYDQLSSPTEAGEPTTPGVHVHKQALEYQETCMP